MAVTGALEAVGALSFTDICLMELPLVAVLDAGSALYFQMQWKLNLLCEKCGEEMIGYLFCSIIVVAKIFWSVAVLIFIVVVVRGLALFLFRLPRVLRLQWRQGTGAGGTQRRQRGHARNERGIG